MIIKILETGDEDLFLEFLQWLTPEALDLWYPYGKTFDLNIVKKILANPDELRIAGIDTVERDISLSYPQPPKKERIVVYGHLYHFTEDSCRLGIISGITGKGYGTQMMKILINYAKSTGTKRIFLSVDQNNYPALALYKKFDFKIIQAFTDKPRHRFEMVKEL
jgi:GNAT superfamily N-acetyltransferase